MIATGAGIYAYYKYESDHLKKDKSNSSCMKSIVASGNSGIGGRFSLTSHTGEKLDTNLPPLKDKWKLLYFGFTHCPDVCPEELGKLALVLNKLSEKQSRLLGKLFSSKREGEEDPVGIKVNLPQKTHYLVPLFISCDPKRDTPEVMSEYLKGTQFNVEG